MSAEGFFEDLSLILSPGAPSLGGRLQLPSSERQQQRKLSQKPADPPQGCLCVPIPLPPQADWFNLLAVADLVQASDLLWDTRRCLGCWQVAAQHSARP